MASGSENIEDLEHGKQSPEGEFGRGGLNAPEKLDNAKSETEQEALSGVEQEASGTAIKKDKEISTASQSDQPVKQTAKDSREEKIERILEEDMEDIYRSMDAEHRHMFARAGEETTRKISKLLQETRVKASMILELIKSWLRMVPGINKWFVVQEAKIKTEKIIKLKNENTSSSAEDSA